MKFRVVEDLDSTSGKYMLCKSLNAEKKSLNIVAILPQVLVNKWHLSAFRLEDFSFEALVLTLQEDSRLPVISAQPDLISMREEMPKQVKELESEKTFVGVVAETSKHGVAVMFLDGVKRTVLMKDLETT